MSDDTIHLSARDLPKLLAPIDKDDLEGSIGNLMHDLESDEIALKIGRAFLLGRLHAFQGNTHAFNPHAEPVLPTACECNLYAGGYQYDFEDNPNDLLETFIKQEDNRSGASLEEVQKSMAELEEVAEELSKQPMAPNTMGDLLNRKIDLRCHILMATINNMIERMNFHDMRIALMSRSMAPPQGLPGNLKDIIAQMFGDNVRRPPAR